MPEFTFPLYFKLIDRYQREDPILTGKLTCAEHKKDSFRGGRNTIKRITYKNEIVIPQQLQRYIVKCYHTYLLHTIRDQTEAMICQHLYWTDIRNTVRKEFTECNICQHTKRSTKTYVQLPDKISEEIPWNKLCLDLIGPYKTRIKWREP